MSRIRALLILIGLGFLVYAGAALALDAPHTGALVKCSSCHTLHNALGAGLTKAEENANLCLSCHFGGGLAMNKSFSSAMQPGGTLQTSHSWVGSMPNSVNDLGANNPYGLRTDAQVTDGNLQNQFNTYGTCSNTQYTNRSACNTAGQTWTAQVVCATCHRVMYQTNTPWDPMSIPDVTGTASGGTTTTLVDISQNWATDQWAGQYVRMTSGSNNNVSMLIANNTKDTLTLATGMAFANAVTSGDSYGIHAKGRHFMRTADDLNQMCESCHYYRSPAYLASVPAGCVADPDPQKCNLDTWDGNKKSHPVMKNLTTDVANASLFIGAAPYEPNCKDPGCAQTGAPRYHLNGGADTNTTNNIVLDANGKIRCLSCHGMHYTDSNSSTVDQP